MRQSQTPILESLLLTLLDGASYATAIRRNGKPGRILLPEEPGPRTELIGTHFRGEGRVLNFRADDCATWHEHVENVVLAAYCPAPDGRCRWVGIDLDASDHGMGGLADPAHAVRVIAERASNAGLLDGLLIARSRRGNGRHVFLILPEPVPLDDAVVGLAGLIAAAYRIAAADVTECESAHAFRRADGQFAQPGQPGAIELIPHSTRRPAYGWALTLPAAGAYAHLGGGIIVDPFTDQPIALENVPSCNPDAWSCLVTESRSAIAKSRKPAKPKVVPPRQVDPIDRIDERTRSFIQSGCPEGHRNRSVFAASANLLGCGIPESDAWQLIQKGSETCGLPEREARSAYLSAAKSIQRRARL